MKQKRNISRKKFFQILSWILLIPFTLLWEMLVEDSKKINSKSKPLMIPKELPNGVSFFPGVITVKDSHQIEFYSSKCSHLGCRINKTVGENIVCPCHGSRYNFNGEVIKGPASKNLTKLNYQRTENGGYLVEV